MVKWEHLLIPCWLLFSSVVCSSYNEFYCPSTLEWILRGRWYCAKYTNQNGDYSCLYNDITEVYNESCRFEAHLLDRGKEYVLKHNPTGVACKDDSKYQPFGFHRFQSGCVFQRTKCYESGQVVYHKGNATVDAVCRCNFKEGYAFIKTPKAVCSCTPSEEDCSCYLKICQHDYELTADYNCVHKNNKSYFSSCPEMYPIGVVNKNKYNKDMISKELKIEGQDRLHFIIGPTILLVMCLMFTVVACTLVKTRSLPSSCFIHIDSPHNLKLLQEGKKLKLSWSKGKNEHSSETKYIVYVTYSDTWENEKTLSKTADAGKLHCYLTSIFLPSKTYRFKVSACLNDIESEACDEVTFETGLPKSPQVVKTSPKERNILLQWAPPELSLFEIDQYRIQYTTNDTWTNPPEYVSAKSVEYVVKEVIVHTTYRFRICACSHGIEGENLERLYSTDHTYETYLKYNMNCLAKNVEQNLCNLHSEQLDTFPGTQTLLDTSVTYGSVIVVFTFISNGFYDVTVMRDTLEQAFRTCCVGQINTALSDFNFRPLNNPEPPQLVRAEIDGPNKVTVFWDEPKKTFFKTKQFILQFTTNDWGTLKTKFVPPYEQNYCISNVLPASNFKCRIYSEICHSIRSVASNVACTFVEGPSPPQNVCGINTDTSLEISWTAPIHPILDFVKHFKIEIEKNGNTSFTTVGKDKFSYLLPNCQPSTIYRFKVYTCTTNQLTSEASPVLEIEKEEMQSLPNELGFECAQVPFEHLEENRFTLKNKFKLVNKPKIKDAKPLPNGLLVLAVFDTKQLITMSMSGEEQKTLLLDTLPCNIAVIDNDTVVVSLLKPSIVNVVISLIDIRQGHVIRNIVNFNSKKSMDSFPIVYANNKLYIHSCYGEISVIDLTGSTATKIMLLDKVTQLSNMCYDVRTDCIYGTTLVEPGLICINRKGTCKPVFEFTKHGVASPRNVCVDNKSHLHVICTRKSQEDFIPPKYHVYRIIPNKDSIQELIPLPLSWQVFSPCISYHLNSNTLIIAYGHVISEYTVTVDSKV